MVPPTSLKGEIVGRLSRRKTAKSEPASFWALRDATFTLFMGDRLGVIGDNGAGKSTLLKIIAGVLPPTAGSAGCYGRVYSLLQYGMGFNPELTGEENVYMGMSYFGLGRQEVRPLLDDVFDFCELGEFRTQPLKTYSGGMVARLAFAVSTAIDPDVLVLDEVFAAGDIHWVDKALERLVNIMNKSRLVIMASHSMGQIRQYTNKVMWLDKGEIRAFGGEEVVDAYERRT